MITVLPNDLLLFFCMRQRTIKLRIRRAMKAMAPPVTIPSMGTSTRDCRNSGNGIIRIMLQSEVRYHKWTQWMKNNVGRYIVMPWPASVRLLCTVPTLLLTFRERFPDRLLSMILSVWLANQGFVWESRSRKSVVLATNCPDWSTKEMVAGGLDRTKANRTRASPGSEVWLWLASTLKISGLTDKEK